MSEKQRKFCRTGLVMSEEFAWFLGMLAADGGLTVRGRIAVFPGLDDSLMGRVYRTINSLFGVEPAVRLQNKGPENSSLDWVVTLERVAVWEELQKWASFGLYTWTVPGAVKKASDEIKSAYIRGFVDGDGTVGDGLVSCCSVNIASLCDVAQLFADIGIQHSFIEFDQDDVTRKRVGRITAAHHADVQRYRDVVGSWSLLKSARLDEACKREFYPVRRGTVPKVSAEIVEMRQKRIPIAEIAEKFELSKGTVSKEIKRLGIAGKIPRGGPVQRLLPEILALQVQGFTFAQIAIKLDLTDEQAVNGVLIRARRDGLLPKPTRGELRARAERAAPFVAQGKSWDEIGALLGETPEKVRRAHRYAVQQGWLSELPQMVALPQTVESSPSGLPQTVESPTVDRIETDDLEGTT